MNKVKFFLLRLNILEMVKIHLRIANVLKQLLSERILYNWSHVTENIC